MTTAQILFMTLLSMFRFNPEQQCMERTAVASYTHADEAERQYGVPPGILLMVAFLETHVGCDHGEGGNWGAPISRFQRHRAGTAFHAARALQRSFQVCGTWRGAISRFRCGWCRCNPRILEGYTPDYAIRWINLLYQRANLPAPNLQ